METGLKSIPINDLCEILDNLGIGIVLDDAAGNILWANQGYQKITGVDIRKYIGKTVWDITRDRDIIYVDINESLFESTVKAGKPVYNALKYKTSNHVITTTAPLYGPDGALKYVICTVADYSEASVAQQALALAYEKIDALESRLKDFETSRRLVNSELVVQNVQMQRLYCMARRLSRSTIPVMLYGETGTGKDVLAKYIHSTSDRKDQRFVHVNMGAIPPTLFESELFGYVAGAFTGASKFGNEGLIRQANKGTLFLDEIGELPLHIQVKLLQVLQERTVRSVGGLSETPVDIRIIAATNRNLEEMVEKGEFRLDLYYRLNVAELWIPPLRERPDDIPLLIQTFLHRFNTEYRLSRTLAPETVNLLLQYSWPGNIRELRHTIESIVVLSPLPVIGPEYLPPEIQACGSGKRGGFPTLGTEHGSLKATMNHIECQLIKEAISASPTLAAAAASLGLDASTLAKKRKKYGI